MNEIKDIPLEKIVEFPKHPYKVLDDENMAELVESIRFIKKQQSKCDN